MQSNFHEMNAVLAAFQLPRLHPEIPVNAHMIRHVGSDALLAKQLLDAKVIRPADIPSCAVSPTEVLRHGLNAWFNRRTSRLCRVKFSLSLHDRNSADEILQFVNGEPDRVLQGTHTLTVDGIEDRWYRMEGQAKYLERACPGLFRAAFDAVTSASYRTVQLRLPIDLLNEVCGMYWETDWSQIPSDKEARTTLEERFGEGEPVDEYLPSRLIPVCGGKHCNTWSKTRLLSSRKLRRFADNSPSKKARRVALATIALRDATDKAKALDASLPDLCGIPLTNVYRGCTLLFKEHDIVNQLIDDEINCAYNAGDATEMLGMAELPTTTEELITFFHKLDVAFNVLKHMDHLIALISSKTQDWDRP